MVRRMLPLLVGKKVLVGHFDGVDQYASVADPADGALDVGAGDFALEAWAVRDAATGADQEIAHKGVNVRYLLRQEDAGEFVFNVDDGGTEKEAKSPLTYGPGVLRPVVGLRIGTNIKLMVGGVVVDTTAIAAYGSLDNAEAFLVAVNSGLNKYFKGSLVLVRLWTFGPMTAPSDVLDAFAGHAAVGPLGPISPLLSAYEITDDTANIPTGDDVDFEGGIGNWVKGGANDLVSSADQAYTGAKSGKLTYQDTRSPLMSLAVTLKTGFAYNLSSQVWVPADWGGGVIVPQATNFDGSTVLEGVNSSGTGSFVPISLTIVPASDVTGFFKIASAQTPTAGKSIYVDHVMIHQVGLVGSYLDGKHTSWEDYTLNGNDLTPVNSPTFRKVRL